MAKSLVDKILLEYVQSTPLPVLMKKYKSVWPSNSGSGFDIADNEQNQKGLTVNVVPSDFDKIPDLLKKLENEGWFCSFINVDWQEYGPTGPYYNYSQQNLEKAKKEAKKNISLEVEPYYDAEDEKKRIVVHLTPVEDLDIIQKEGLKPLSKNTLATHPNRIYLLRVDNPPMRTWMFAAQLYSKLKLVDKNISGVYAKLKVDLTNLPEVKLYKDPDFDNGLYTDIAIPPSAITLLEKKDIRPIVKKMQDNGLFS